MDEFGPLESATRTAISELGVMDGINRPLAELCIALSQRIDSGAGGMAASAIARELRETLQKLTEVTDADDRVQSLLDRFSSPVLTEVRNTETA